ncbi:hypothetical protein BCR32DRAFT_296997 [Anaeromyces robustus]|uniref:Uncharacterized protein n=1 Tax=Anaeromyces robustus TaxID=1754192 RepID=A0A1Y1WPN1_9FUNG|nr:hypothetical protein BCR32DRAFT_296997 [Anaeromyces robustus]|eukprot:ORX75248.1 hypothetical protein BCR32DRAFT_296997 [Anaeromyces robustus]
MDFFLNWCINCGKCSEYLYCCNECRINDLKRNKASCINDNNYTLEFKNRKHCHSNSYYNTKHVKNTNMSPVSPLLKINIPNQTADNSNNSFRSSSSTSSSSSDLSNMANSTNKTNIPSNPMSLSIYSSPPKEGKSQRPRYYVQTFHDQETNNQNKQILTPLSEKDSMECDNVTNAIFPPSQMSSSLEVNENSSHWYWSSSDDEDDD